MTLESTLGLLETAGLIRRSGGQADREFAFRHTLLRDTAYSSLLREERRELHRQVGQAIEELQSDQNGELASLLAHHYLAGDLEDKALVYLRRAGDEAARVYALAEALNHYGRALELAGRGHGSGDDLLYLYERRGRMLELAGRYEEALENYRELEQVGKRASQPGHELRGLLRQATLHAIPTAVMDGDKGRGLSERALEMAREAGDRSMQSLAHWNLMRVSEFALDLKAAREHGERALELVQDLDLPEQRAFILNDLVGAYVSTAEFEKAVMVNSQAIELWTQLDNQPMLVDAYCNEIALGLFRGDYASAQEYSRKGAQISETIGNTWGRSYSRYLIYWIHAERGDIKLALRTARQCVELAEQAGFIVPQFQTRADIGFLHSLMGEFDQAHAMLDHALEQAQALFPSWEIYPQAVKLMTMTWEGRLDEAQGYLRDLDGVYQAASIEEFNYVAFLFGVIMPEYWLAQGDWQRALSEADYFLEVFERFQLQFLKSDLYLHRGQALLHLKRVEEAQRALEDGLRQADRVGSQRILWRLHDALARAAQELGQQESADAHKRAAGESVAYIADRTESESQRQSFLNHVPRLSLIGEKG